VSEYFCHCTRPWFAEDPLSNLFSFRVAKCLAMRRIYYRFPQRVDLSFAMGMPFNETLNYIAGLDNEESTKTTGKELVKVKLQVRIAIDRATFGEITPDALRPGVITEAVDLQASVLALALRGGNRVPIANDIFYIRLTDQVSRTDIDIAKEGHGEGLDALDMKNILLGAKK
jgi:hypothetical protein